MPSILNKIPLKQFIQFCLVGSGGALIQLGMTYVLTEFAGLWYMASVFVAILMALMFNFTMNYRWTFAKREAE